MPKFVLAAALLAACACCAGVADAQSATPAPAPSPSASPKPAPSPAASAKPSGAPSPAASATPVPSPTPFKLLSPSGSADMGFTHVGGTDTVRFVNGAASRIFDGFAAVSPQLLQAFAAGTIGVQQLPTSNNVPDVQNINLQLRVNGALGAFFETSVGSDADATASNGQSHTSGFNVTQAYLQYQRGLFTLIAGKFSTLAGAEVIESANNFNFSRSYLFGEAVPFTHTGARLTYAPNSKISIIAGANNGWDDWLFQGKALTIEGGLAINPSPAITLTLQTYNGPDCIYTDPNNPYRCVPPFGNRSLYDGVLTVHATSALTLVANYDDGVQHLITSSGGPFPTVVPNPRWDGFAGYAVYQFTPRYGLALRHELFRDNGGFRTGIDQLLHSSTATVNFTPSTPLLFRLEYRLDTSSKPAFAYNGAPAGVGRNTQNSIGVETVFKF